MDTDLATPAASAEPWRRRARRSPSAGEVFSDVVRMSQVRAVYGKPTSGPDMGRLDGGRTLHLDGSGGVYASAVESEGVLSLDAGRVAEVADVGRREG